MNIVEMSSVNKSFSGHQAVKDLNLHVPEGSVYGFIGPNGSGKTTTLRMIMNIFFPDRGEISVFGEPNKQPFSDRIGYLPEERGLYKSMKVKNLLRYLGRLKNTSDLNNQIDYWLNKMALQDWSNKKVETLSKGMSQKVQFIAAVICNPRLLILDEPFSGLDPVNTEVLREAVLEMQKRGTTIIFSTHDMATAENMCDFILMIHKGEKVLDGTLDAIQDKYGDDTVRVRIEGDSTQLDNLPGIAKVTNFGQMQEIRLTAENNPQEILEGLVNKYVLKHFEITKPSLHDIFVRIAGPSAQEVENE